MKKIVVICATIGVQILLNADDAGPLCTFQVQGNSWMIYDSWGYQDSICTGVEMWCDANLLATDRALCKAYAIGATTLTNAQTHISTSTLDDATGAAPIKPPPAGGHPVPIKPTREAGYSNTERGQHWAEYKWHMNHNSIDLLTSCLMDEGQNGTLYAPQWWSHADFCEGADEWCRQNIHDIGNLHSCRSYARQWQTTGAGNASSTDWKDRKNARALNALHITADDDKSRGRAWAAYWWDVLYNKNTSRALPAGA